MIMIRATAPDPFDAPLADRQSINVFLHHWNELTAQSEALEQRMTDVLEAHRADCRARYGRDFEGGDK